MIGDIERVDDEFIMFPQQNETICRISSFEPDKKYQNVASDSASYFSDLDAGEIHSLSQKDIHLCINQKQLIMR